MRLGSESMGKALNLTGSSAVIFGEASLSSSSETREVDVENILDDLTWTGLEKQF